MMTTTERTIDYRDWNTVAVTSVNPGDWVNVYRGVPDLFTRPVPALLVQEATLTEWQVGEGLVTETHDPPMAIGLSMIRWMGLIRIRIRSKSGR
jgi:hypothetical protein